MVLEHRAAPISSGAEDAERAVALGASSWGSVEASAFSTGAELFDREWAFGTPMMRTACLAQVSMRHPGLAGELAKPLVHAVADLTGPNALLFTRSRWGSDPLREDVAEHDHAAFLGYAGFALGLAAGAGVSGSEETHAAVVGRLQARMDRAEGGWIETYPGEVYPVDYASGIGALATAARLRGEQPADDPTIARALARLRTAVDAKTGLLIQAIDPASGEPVDGPRGSGTFLAAYFLVPADAELARSLWEAGRRELRSSTLGFVAMRERPASAPGGGDVDSGPIILGYGVSSTGFALGPARAFEDRTSFASLWATASLFGAPEVRDGALTHVTGGPLGDASLCAMATAPAPDEIGAWMEGGRS